MSKNLVFIKLGGSLITNKRQEATPRIKIIRRLAKEVLEARQAMPELHIMMGHGAGSFGHWEGNRYGTREGVCTPEQWIGFARVGAAAIRLNRIVVDIFQEVGVPVLSLQPLASALSDNRHILNLNDESIRRALEHNLIPFIFGDIAFDEHLGGTILSTEDLFVHLAKVLQPERILLLGNAPGVLDNQSQIIPKITPQNYHQFDRFLKGASSTDVTGGMVDKVNNMVELVKAVSSLRVWIFTGQEPGNLKRALLTPGKTPGTCIANET